MQLGGELKWHFKTSECEKEEEEERRGFKAKKTTERDAIKIMCERNRWIVFYNSTIKISDEE